MLNKLYDKLKKLVKENHKFLVILFILFGLFNVKLPYYIECPGGILDVSKRVELEQHYTINGSFNLAYVTSFKATIPSLIYASMNKNWDIIKKEDMLMQEKEDVIEYRNHIMLDEANANAVVVAFRKAKEYYNITNRKLIVVYTDEKSDTNLKIGDQIIEVNGVKVDSREDILNLLNDDKITFRVLNDDNEKYAKKVDIDGEKLLGIIISEVKDVDTNIDVRFKFDESESGPSGGFMMALSIYNYLTPDDITGGRKIVGTGTIDENGNVGSIGGIKYKLIGASKEKADLFFVPEDNYEEALKVAKENKLSIKIVKIKHIDDAINYLKNS